MAGSTSNERTRDIAVDVDIEIPGADAYGEVGIMLYMARNAAACSSYGPMAFREVIAIERIGFAD